MPTRGSGRSLPQLTWLALITVYIAWGSTYVGIRVMDETVPPLLGAGIRYACAGLAMYAFLSWA